jgi:hypothetical protein
MPNQIERRSETRRIVDEYYSVEFSIGDIPFLYQFKIWDLSTNGMCVLAKEGSDILKHLKVGDRVKMRYYQVDSMRPTGYLQTEIRHITKEDQGRLRGHYLIGLSILETPPAP